jgi:hypothetical protein
MDSQQYQYIYIYTYLFIYFIIIIIFKFSGELLLFFEKKFEKKIMLQILYFKKSPKIVTQLFAIGKSV